MTTDSVAGVSTGAPHGRADDLLTKLSDTIGARMTTANVFGTPVERDGVTVVPVAAVRFGFGGGAGGTGATEGPDPAQAQEGEGAGGMGQSSPVGYIEIMDGRSRFVPVVNPARMMGLMCGSALAGLLIARPREIRLVRPTAQRRGRRGRRGRGA